MQGIYEILCDGFEAAKEKFNRVEAGTRGRSRESRKGE